MQATAVFNQPSTAHDYEQRLLDIYYRQSAVRLEFQDAQQAFLKLPNSENRTRLEKAMTALEEGFAEYQELQTWWRNRKR